jgi:hypothetical protein|tara:strand:+ start:259 stop:537 length:279 start_codon:yes stop_codon:yes gene_type:complete
MKLRKKLKDPNEKNAIQKFFGGKIPHYLAVVAFLFSSYNLFSFQFVKMRYNSLNEKRDVRMKELVENRVNEYFSQQFPDTTGPVLKKYIKKK